MSEQYSFKSIHMKSVNVERKNAVIELSALSVPHEKLHHLKNFSRKMLPEMVSLYFATKIATKLTIYKSEIK
jgi:hypothetical protein